jgi:2-oxo-3-hexenedioate decarboxylase
VTVDVDKWAAYLLDAEARRQAVAPITDTEPGLSVDDGYAIQDALIARREAAGERVIGVKLGLTSRAKQQAMNVNEPCFAVLTDAMHLPAEQPVRLGELIHPRVEPEIVLYLAHDLAGPGVTAQDVLDAAAAVCCGLEVIDSRYADFKFTLADVVADNASSARFTLGTQRVDPRTVDLALAGCLLERDGDLVATAAGAAVLGHPAEAVARLSNWLGRRGRTLRAGWAVLSGGLTDAFALSDGSHVVATFGHLGRVGLWAVA